MFVRYIRPAGCLHSRDDTRCSAVYFRRSSRPSDAVYFRTRRRESDLSGKTLCRFPAHRAEIRGPEVFLGPAIRHFAAAV